MRCEPQLQLGAVLESRLGDAVGGVVAAEAAVARVRRRARLRQVRLELRGSVSSASAPTAELAANASSSFLSSTSSSSFVGVADALAEELVEERLVRHERGVVVFVRGMNLRAVDAVRDAEADVESFGHDGVRGVSPLPRAGRSGGL